MQILGRDILITLIVISIIVYINSQLKNKKGTSLYNTGIILLSVVMVIIFSLTGVSPISGFNIEIRIDEISFIPFRDIIEMLKGGLTLHTIINILGNIIMFMPMGFLLPLLFSNLDSLKKTLVLGFGTSLLIEFTKLF
ncbi:VanZ family protein [Terrisporobacter sp.]|uniref:VanZ family protein n=1 Tax=Terrisporobacter sp. TaxID=1965305 RepID=UPI00261DF949|nr:VanZ family protein [Terrisporobacter sp.]